MKATEVIYYPPFKLEGQLEAEPLSQINSETIHTILLNIGIPTNLLGYSYMIHSIELISNDSTYLHSITKRLYVDVAKAYKTTPSRVERAIRHAISVGWSHGNLEYINTMFKNSINPEKGIPTNSQFMSRIYYYLLCR